MGLNNSSARGQWRGDEEETAASAAISEEAAVGARDAATAWIERALQDAEAGARSRAPDGRAGGGVGGDLYVAGVLPLSEAQAAAAQGAGDAIRAMARYLTDPAGMQTAATAGAAAGVRAAALAVRSMLQRLANAGQIVPADNSAQAQLNPIGDAQLINAALIADAADAGARAGVLAARGYFSPVPATIRYSSLLGVSLPVLASLRRLVTASADASEGFIRTAAFLFVACVAAAMVVVACATLAVVAVLAALMVCLLDRSPSTIRTLTSFTILSALLASLPMPYRWACGVGGCVFLALLLIARILRAW